MKSLKYSLGASLLLIISFTLTYSLSWYKSFRINAITIIELLVFILAIYLYVKEIKKTKYKGDLSFGFAFLEGLKVVLVVSAIHFLFVYLYLDNNEEVFQNLKNFQISIQKKAARIAKQSEQQILESIELINKESTPFNFAKGIFRVDVLLGLLISLIIAAILRKKETKYEFTGSELKRE